MNICFAQVNPTVGDLDGNKELIVRSINDAKSKKADIILFPEMVTTGYPPKDLILRKNFVLKNIDMVEEIAKACKGISAIVGFVDSRPDGLYNCAAILSEGKIIGIQEKTHLPNYDVFDEKRYFRTATESKIFVLNGKRVGVAICEDIWLDGPVEELKKKGAELILNISASPFIKGKEKVRETEVLSPRCRKNKIPIAYCNLVGSQDDLIFDGHSYYFGADGIKKFEASSFSEGLFYHNTDSNSKLTTIKVDDTEQVFKALVLGIKDYFRKNNFNKAIVGLSGGIDSAITAVLAVEALGKDAVMGITMPSRYSSDGSVEDSRQIAKNLGIQFKIIPIEDIYSSYLKTLETDFKGLPQNVAEENIQARIRGNILMGLSNKFGHIVLSTGNKSELAVGYCTLYGDMSGGLAVISDVPKTLIYKISKYYNSIKGKPVIPISTIEKEPSAELRPDQKDSDSLPEYDILDEILDDYVEKGLDRNDIIKKGFSKEIVDKIIWLIRINEYKRNQAALGLKVTSKAFGSGRRIPITNRWKE